jgi:ubiquinone biosynthesis protein UbiJ
MPASSLNPSSIAVRALGSLLVRESWARERLRAHAGKTACLVFGGTRIVLTVTAVGLVQVADPAAIPDVTLTVAGDRLPELMSGDPARRMAAVRIEGDAALAQVVGDLARDLRWDFEDDLAGLIGDIPAARVVGAASGFASSLRGSAWRLASNVAEYLTEERGVLASSYDLAAWGSEVRRLRDDAERAGKRVEHFQARLARLEARLDKKE